MILLLTLLLVGQLRAPGKPVVSGEGVDPTTWVGSVRLTWDAPPVTSLPIRLYVLQIRAEPPLASPLEYQTWAPGFIFTPGPQPPFYAPVASGTAFYFSVASVDEIGQESPFSPELRTVYHRP